MIARVSAAKVGFPPFMSICAQRSICKKRPKADLQHLIEMLRSQPALRTFAIGAKSDKGRTNSLRDKACFRCGCATDCLQKTDL
jgi:hypothetical protein